ncbi:MAG: FtsH protease activity modulator HflK [Parasphingopyxis sp.]|uniref:FtsH protease activity modulator HflK n=1 Tax=Parasphingopyxis sp. TaxID=1920299 RepID=UPI00260E70E3|nr:FtsH protease activity modulator HflK [uncultured Parasphingopyxis sp.]
MSVFSGIGARLGALFNVGGKGPWGGRGSGGSGSGGGSGNGGGDGGGPKNPWSQPPRRRPGGGGNNRPTALDDLLNRGKSRWGGGGGGRPDLPQFGGRPIWFWAIIVAILLWLFFTSFHLIGPQERGVLTRFGSYQGTYQPGAKFSFPWPIDRVQVVDVENIRTIDIGGTGEDSENRVLTGDQNIVDLAYQVRWNIKEPQNYLFQISDPETTIREVAESAMRAAVARVTLDEAIGSGRSEIEQRVQLLMQELLDGYGAGVLVQGVAIEEADPPAAVEEAFREVSAAQQTAQTYLNDARAYAQQLTARAQGEAAAFTRVYEEYRLAPEVTRRRMYYETMERILAETDITIVEADGGVTPYLPLPEIQRRSRRSQPTPAEGETP